MNEKLDFLVRSNKGKRKLTTYKQFFKGFNLKALEYIYLAEADEITDKIRAIFPIVKCESEMLLNGSDKSSKLISNLLSNATPQDSCYIFTDNVYECGMFRATTISGLKGCLDIAFLDHENTCFLVDSNLRYSCRINYYDNPEHENFDHYDIQIKVRGN